jgi:periplasmic divalent cation tolerance protein
MKVIFVYITNPNKKTAKKIAEHLLKKRLIACANIFPIESAYWWRGKIERAKEYVLIAKTTEKKFEKVKAEIKKIHPYEVPCVVKIKTNANRIFRKWVEKVTK